LAKTTPRLGDKIVLVASDSERRLIFKDLSLLNSGRAVSLRLVNDSNLTVDITATGVLKPGQKGNPYRAKDWNHSTLRITSNVDTSFQVVLDSKTSSLLVGNERNRAFHVAWERNKQGDVVEIVDHYPLYNLGSSHSQQFVVNPDGTIALKSDSSLVLGYDGPNSPPAAAEVRSVIGSWSQHNNIDMCGQGDVEIIPDWKRHKSIDDLKKMVEDRGYSAFTVSNGKPSFGHAALKKFDYILTPQHCKPVSTCCKHPCTIYIFTPGGVGDSQRKEGPAGRRDLRVVQTEIPLTLKSHPGNAICTKTRTSEHAWGINGGWDYYLLHVGPLKEAVRVSWIPRPSGRWKARLLHSSCWEDSKHISRI